jgi:hypothetical protein
MAIDREVEFRELSHRVVYVQGRLELLKLQAVFPHLVSI